MLSLAENHLLRQALRWNRENVNVLPVRPRGKESLIRWKKWQSKSQGEMLVRLWFERKYVGANLGVMCGNLLVVDFDNFPAWYAWSPKNDLKFSSSARTARGVHVYFWIREKISSTYSFENGEIKGNGYVVAPPSIHPSGFQYHWMGGEIKTIGNVDELGIKYEVRNENVAIEGFPQNRVITRSNGIVGRIKRNINIANYLSNLTTGFGYNGNSLMCKCPFHDDNNPSMVVHSDQGWCYCFSPNCIAHKRLDVIDVAALWLEVSNSEAIRILSYEVD